MSEITSPILFDAAVGYANETADASIRGDLRIAFVAGAEWQWKRDAALSAENERLRTERYQLAYAICGGEDAPGYLDSIDVETIAKVCRDNYRDWSSQTDKNIRLEERHSRILAVLFDVVRFGWPANIETNPEARMLGGKKPSTADVWTFPKSLLAGIEAILGGQNPSDRIIALLDDREEAYVKHGLREEDLP